MPLEINCHEQNIFNSTIDRMITNEPELVDVLFEHPNAVDALTIAAMLRVNKTTKRVDLAHGDYLGDFGAEYIAESLKANSTLSELCLRTNNIGDEGVVKLAEALKLNKTLTKLDLSYNNIGDIGAQSIIDALRENKTLIAIDISKVNNHVSSRNIERINTLIERNKRFLHKAIDEFSAGKRLTEEQTEIIKAHLNSENPDVFIGISESVKRNLVEQFRNSMDGLKSRTRDPAMIVSEFLGHSKEVLAFNKSVILDDFKAGRRAKSPADKYFKGLISEITPAIEEQFAHMKVVAGDLGEVLDLKNNVVFIADSINYGNSFAQITSHLEQIAADPAAKAFALANPKKLGYLMTLEERKFNKSMGILNHPKLGEFVRNNPEQIATLTRVSDDPEKLLRAAHAIKEDPSLRSVKEVIKASDERYFKAVKSAKAAEARAGNSR